MFVFETELSEYLYLIKVLPAEAVPFFDHTPISNPTNDMIIWCFSSNKDNTIDNSDIKLKNKTYALKYKYKDGGICLIH